MSQVSRVSVRVEEQLKQVQLENAKKLDELRQTVDEKLHGALERRLGESLKLVGDNLDRRWPRAAAVTSSGRSRSAPALTLLVRTPAGRATRYRRVGAGDLLDLKEEGGWSDLRMVERYTHGRPREERRRAPSPLAGLLQADAGSIRPTRKGFL